MNLSKYIRNIEDFPKAGVRFKDITPLLANPDATVYCLQQLVALLEDEKIDKVVGIESRGFFFATLLAKELKAGFVPIRKPGKLPFNTLKEPYELEYGMDALEIHEDAIKKGERVLLHDDVLATGGTARAACKLIENLGGEIVQCNFLLEIAFLKGVQKLKNQNVKSLLKY
ncbi:adenine phosphoribosyltransferase [Aequorivita xiaoshiensis]|uniref:Adenine phosphoribosyltransferase n=1 Tax=Aequorivita xiaoshiensis TaxID=2874476 RepID=A0A9X1R193_9FLAO|nr:adenine phosphoribosyltransferase [Aequorivita xiaoshiensis]MCG2430870.1 adenine phosphoribosyltransferase [Aequorivita xiaoshiensis]